MLKPRRSFAFRELCRITRCVCPKQKNIPRFICLGILYSDSVCCPAFVQQPQIIPSKAKIHSLTLLQECIVLSYDICLGCWKKVCPSPRILDSRVLSDQTLTLKYVFSQAFLRHSSWHSSPASNKLPKDCPKTQAVAITLHLNALESILSGWSSTPFKHVK